MAIGTPPSVLEQEARVLRKEVAQVGARFDQNAAGLAPRVSPHIALGAGAVGAGVGAVQGAHWMFGNIVNLHFASEQLSSFLGMFGKVPYLGVPFRFAAGIVQKPSQIIGGSTLEDAGHLGSSLINGMGNLPGLRGNGAGGALRGFAGNVRGLENRVFGAAAPVVGGVGNGLAGVAQWVENGQVYGAIKKFNETKGERGAIRDAQKAIRQMEQMLERIAPTDPTKKAMKVGAGWLSGAGNQVEVQQVLGADVVKGMRQELQKIKQQVAQGRTTNQEAANALNGAVAELQGHMRQGVERAKVAINDGRDNKIAQKIFGNFEKFFNGKLGTPQGVVANNANELIGNSLNPFQRASNGIRDFAAGLSGETAQLFRQHNIDVGHITDELQRIEGLHQGGQVYKAAEELAQLNGKIGKAIGDAAKAANPADNNGLANLRKYGDELRGHLTGVTGEVQSQVKFSDKLRNLPNEIKKANVADVAMKGLYVAGSTLHTYRSAKHTLSNIDALKKMHADISGIDVKKVKTSDVLFGKVSPIVAEARKGIMLHGGVQVVSNLVSWGTTAHICGVRMPGSRSRGRPTGMQDLALGMAVQAGTGLLENYANGQNKLLNTYAAIAGKPEMTVEDAAELITVASKEIGKRAGPDHPMVVALAEEYVKLGAKPIDILKEAETRVIDQRAEQVYEKLNFAYQAEAQRISESLSQQRTEQGPAKETPVAASATAADAARTAAGSLKLDFEEVNPAHASHTGHPQEEKTGKWAAIVAPNRSESAAKEISFAQQVQQQRAAMPAEPQLT
jgi:hypothetical protein